MVHNCRIETFTTFSDILSIMKDNTELASRKHDTMTTYFFLNLDYLLIFWIFFRTRTSCLFGSGSSTCNC